MAISPAVSSALLSTQAQANAFQGGAADSIDRTKQLLKMGATVYFTIAEGEDVERAFDIQVGQTLYGDLYTQEKPEKHALSKYPEYSMTPHAFYEKLQDGQFSKKFKDDCSAVFAALKKVEKSCSAEESAEIDKAIMWLSKLLEAMKK